MKESIETKQQILADTNISVNVHKRSLRRFSPFLWLSILLLAFFMYEILTQSGTQKLLILLSFLIVNMVYADYALWRFFNGKRSIILLIIEGLISALIIYWLI